MEKKNSQASRSYTAILKGLAKDSVKSFLIGLISAAAIGCVLFLGGLAFKKGQVTWGLEVAKDGLFLIVAIELIVIVGMLISKGKKQETMNDTEGWRRHFAVFGMKMVLSVVCIGFILVASLADYLMMIIG